ncbi:class I SAM-dependent methyltransferase [Domibacillus iocasae]|uniref:SAM-dependent methyltransferase n=1 Tax=Domibacillus iocasae TaxID=1714016 RepID=A0A1E7DTF2_9BACI|nr:class I SAM-dependent methyltransferase [Domibacillus iocasae]OES46367.1 SAM-dependent methyltransferase [Domibacillus iocasae]
MNDAVYDEQLSIKTTGDQQGFPQLSHYHRYEPTPYAGLDQLFERCELDRTDGFVDVGCGKGRVAFYVHHRFGASVTGIEMNPAFFDVCLQNKIGYMKKRKRQRGFIDFQCRMAQDYEVKAEDTVFYFFNPFSVQIFMKVIQHILASVEHFPRKVTIILYYPSDEYVYFLQNQTIFKWRDEVQLHGLYEKNENERFVLFQNEK